MSNFFNSDHGLKQIAFTDLTGALGNSQLPALPATTPGTGLTAVGTTQGTALALTAQISEITTCASGAGVQLPNSVGTTFIVSNQGANACLVYPISSAQINALGTNVAFSLPVGSVIEFIQVSSTQYRTLNTTYA